jgi:hypothetical protein
MRWPVRGGSGWKGVVIRDVSAGGATRPATAEPRGVNPARWHILKDGEAWPLS